jgi:hypothetical protein
VGAEIIVSRRSVRLLPLSSFTFCVLQPPTAEAVLASFMRTGEERLKKRDGLQAVRAELELAERQLLAVAVCASLPQPEAPADAEAAVLPSSASCDGDDSNIWMGDADDR